MDNAPDDPANLTVLRPSKRFLTQLTLQSALACVALVALIVSGSHGRFPATASAISLAVLTIVIGAYVVATYMTMRIELRDAGLYFSFGPLYRGLIPRDDIAAIEIGRHGTGREYVCVRRISGRRVRLPAPNPSDPDFAQRRQQLNSWWQPPGSTTT